MRIREVQPGQIVAVSTGLAAKHLNVIDDPSADDELADSVGVLDALVLMSSGRREAIARRLNDNAPIVGHYGRMHRGVVREVGLPWGGRKVGVIVHLETNERMTRYLERLGIAELIVTVPASMLTDYWDYVAEMEMYKAEREAQLDARWEEHLAGRPQPEESD
jgi:hypothetical protein